MKFVVGLTATIPDGDEGRWLQDYLNKQGWHPAILAPEEGPEKPFIDEPIQVASIEEFMDKSKNRGKLLFVDSEAY